MLHQSGRQSCRWVESAKGWRIEAPKAWSKVGIWGRVPLPQPTRSFVWASRPPSGVRGDAQTRNVFWRILKDTERSQNAPFCTYFADAWVHQTVFHAILGGQAEVWGRNCPCSNVEPRLDIAVSQSFGETVHSWMCRFRMHQKCLKQVPKFRFFER